MPDNVTDVYFTVHGDSPRSIDMAVRIMQYHGLVGWMEARDIGNTLAFGPSYSRVVRDNVDRMLWALLQQGDKEAAQRWADQARAAYKHWKESR